MHWFVYPTFLLLLVLLSVHAGDDEIAAIYAAAKPNDNPDLDVKTTTEVLPIYDAYCKNSYYERWYTYMFNEYVECRVNVGGCKRYRCGKLPWDCTWCLPVYKYIKCNSPKPKKIRVVKRCKCRHVKKGGTTTPATDMYG